MAQRMLDERWIDILVRDAHGDCGGILELPKHMRMRRALRDEFDNMFAVRQPTNEVVGVAVRGGGSAASIAGKPRMKLVRLGRFVGWTRKCVAY